MLGLKVGVVEPEMVAVKLLIVPPLATVKAAGAGLGALKAIEFTALAGAEVTSITVESLNLLGSSMLVARTTTDPTVSEVKVVTALPWVGESVPTPLIMLQRTLLETTAVGLAWLITAVKVTPAEPAVKLVALGVTLATL